MARRDCLERSTQKMLACSEALRGRDAGLRVLNLGAGDVDTRTRMGSVVFTVMAKTKLEVKQERITYSLAERRAGGKDLSRRRPTFTDSQIRIAVQWMESGGLPPRSPATSGCLEPPCTGGSGSYRHRHPRSQRVVMAASRWMVR